MIEDLLTGYTNEFRSLADGTPFKYDGMYYIKTSGHWAVQITKLSYIGTHDMVKFKPTTTVTTSRSFSVVPMNSVLKNFSDIPIETEFFYSGRHWIKTGVRTAAGCYSHSKGRPQQMQLTDEVLVKVIVK